MTREISTANCLTQLGIPGLSSFPMSTPIPFHLLVVTKTKSLRLSEAPSPFTTNRKSLFPAPPTSASQIDLHLTCHVDIRAQGSRRYSKNRVASLGGMGNNRPLSARLGENLHMRTAEPEWVPQAGEKDEDEKDRGVWRRKVHFESSMMFWCPPSFSGNTLSNQVCTIHLRVLWQQKPTIAIDKPLHKYAIVMKIPFPGLGNKVKSAFRINIVSSSPPRSSSDASYANAPDMPLVMELSP